MEDSSVQHQRTITSRTWRAARGSFVVAAIAGALAAQCSPAGARVAAKHTTAAAATKRDAAKLRTAKRKAAMRRALAREVRRNPRRALASPTFLRRASSVDFQLPVTFRLRPETQMAVTMLGNRRPLDELTYPEPTAAQPLDLAGQFGGEISFGDTGFGIIGSFQARSGNNLQFSSTSPLRIADFADCGTPPPSPLPAFVEMTPSTTLAMSAGPLNWTTMNPFSGAASGSLYVNLSLTSRVRRSDATCSAPGDAADFSVPATLPADAPVPAAPVRLDWAGKFRIAPAITIDGAIRLGKIDGDTTVSPEPLTTGNIWACAPTSVLSGPTVPTGAACSEQSAPLTPAMEAVGAAPFAAQFSFNRFAVDVLLGDVPPPPPAPLVP